METGGVRTITGGQEVLSASTTTTIVTNRRYTVRATRQWGLGHDITLPSRMTLPSHPRSAPWVSYRSRSDQGGSGNGEGTSGLRGS
jgi:hypothetical protein